MEQSTASTTMSSATLFSHLPRLWIARCEFHHPCVRMIPLVVIGRAYRRYTPHGLALRLRPKRAWVCHCGCADPSVGKVGARSCYSTRPSSYFFSFQRHFPCIPRPLP